MHLPDLPDVQQLRKGNAKETMFCWTGRSFMCIAFEKKCICPTCR